MRNRNRSGRFAPDGSYLLPSERVAEERDPEDVHLDNIAIAGDDLEIADGLAVAQPFADGLARKAQLRHHKWNNLDQTANFVRNNPPSVLAGTLGGQQPTSTDQQLQVAFWSGDDAETLPVTVTLAPVQYLTSTPAESIFSTIDPFRPYGIVKFGTRGFLVAAEVDIGFGCQFTVSGSTCMLQVAMDSFTAAPGVSSVQMLLAGMLSFHPIVRTAPLTRTRYCDSVANGNQQATDVPPFAKNVICWRTSRAEPFSLLFKGHDGATLYSFLVAANTDMTDPIALSGEVAQVVFDNTGANAQHARLIYELSL